MAVKEILIKNYNHNQTSFIAIIHLPIELLNKGSSKKMPLRGKLESCFDSLISIQCPFSTLILGESTNI